MPRIWIMFLTHLMKQCKITRTRRAFDDALRALPLTQHDRIWKLYLSFAISASGITAIRVWKRYMQVQPELREDFISLLHDLHAIPKQQDNTSSFSTTPNSNPVKINRIISYGQSLPTCSSH